MSVPVQNIPIALKNVITTFEGFSGSSDLILSTITVFPGTQPETEGGFVRNWNFVISGALTSPELIVTVPCPSKNFYFNIDSYVADGVGDGIPLDINQSYANTSNAGCTVLGYSYDSTTYTITLTSLVCYASTWYGGGCEDSFCGTQNTGNQTFIFQFTNYLDNKTIYVKNNTGSGFNANQIQVNYGSSTTIGNTNSGCNFNATISTSIKSWTSLNNCQIL